MGPLADRCPCCGGTRYAPIFALREVPILCNRLWPDPGSAEQAPRGDVDLVLCGACAMIWNRGYDGRRMHYEPGYENALHFSPQFASFAAQLAATLVADLDLEGKDVVEIGCGDGFMLDQLARLGVASATGYDPSMVGVSTPYDRHEAVRIVPEPFHAADLPDGLGLVLCRHVLEHLEQPAGLLDDLSRALSGRTVPLYVEVPNARWMLDSVSMWDVIYEHITYWTPPALKTLFRQSGFRPIAMHTAFGDQFLQLLASPAEPGPGALPEDIDAVREAARAFGGAARATLAHWRSRLNNERGRTVVWGAGSKGITFVNALGEAARNVVALVDVNPRKTGMYLPGSATPVVAPADLPELAPDLVLVANAHYEAEIAAHLRFLGLATSTDVIAG